MRFHKPARPHHTVAIAIGLLLGIALHLYAAPTTAPATSAPATKEASVEIDNFAYKPKSLEIAAGTKVTWTNKDDVPHTATSSDTPAAFDSKTLDTDDHYTFTFTTPGTYKYYCKVHPHMTATIVVK